MWKLFSNLFKNWNYIDIIKELFKLMLNNPGSLNNLYFYFVCFYTLVQYVIFLNDLSIYIKKYVYVPKRVCDGFLLL